MRGKEKGDGEAAEKGAAREGNDVDLREFVLLMMCSGGRRMEIKLLLYNGGGSESGCDGGKARHL